MSGRGAAGAISVFIGGFLTVVALRFETGAQTLGLGAAFICLGGFFFWRAVRASKR